MLPVYQLIVLNSICMLNSLFRITTSEQAPYLSGQLCLQFGNLVFALLEPVPEEKAFKNIKLDNRELLQRRHRHNLWIWLVDQGKILVMHARHALKTIELQVQHAPKTIVLHVWQVPKTIVLHVRYALNTIVLHVRHALLNNSVPSLQINDVKLPHFRFRWQLEKTKINLYFLYLFQRRALTAVQLKRISPALCNLNKME